MIDIRIYLFNIIKVVWKVLRLSVSLNKNIRVILTVSGLVMSFAVISLLLSLEASAKTPNTKPYKATTVDECIQEEECVWYAFGLQLGLFDYTQWVMQGKALHKWNRPISFLPYGEEMDDIQPYFDDLDKVAGQIVPLFPYEIQLSEKQNYYMIFSKDPEKSFYKIEPQFDEAMGKGEARASYDRIKDIYEGCFSLPLRNQDNEIIYVFSIIDTKSPYAKKCIAENFYSTLGFIGYLPHQPFSALSDKEDQNIEYSNLDKFLIYLLYQPEFKAGQDPNEVKEIFSKIYERTKSTFYKK